MVADYLFITGILAADSLELVLERMNPEFTYRVEVLNISVAALMNTEWIARHLPVDAYGCSQIIIPGSCKGNLTEIEDKTVVRAVRGPKDLKDVPVFFGGEQEVRVPRFGLRRFLGGRPWRSVGSFLRDLARGRAARCERYL